MYKYILLLSLLFSLSPPPVFAGTPPEKASFSGKYKDLIQVLPCPTDSADYGSHHDYGYYSGSEWCGQTGKAGYWVYYSGSWYIWKTEVETIPAKASMNGDYIDIIQVLPCLTDSITYGSHYDWGYYAGGEWCGQGGKSGYWVY